QQRFRRRSPRDRGSDLRRRRWPTVLSASDALRLWFFHRPLRVVGSRWPRTGFAFDRRRSCVMEKLKYETPELRVLPGMWKDSIHHRMIVQLKSERDALSARLQNCQQELVEKIDVLADAGRDLRDLLRFYDRAVGSDQSALSRVKDEGGWTATEVRRLEEIRKLVS